MTMDKAYRAQKAIQDYVFTDGLAEKSVERKFAENLDGAEEVFIYAKLPKGFYIPTPVGHYSPDWAIVFHEGMVKHMATGRTRRIGTDWWWMRRPPARWS